jgi:uncharacterized repeat protein (TIGR01451 family)
VAAADEDQVSFEGWFSDPFYTSLTQGDNFWNAWQTNRHMVDFRGMSHQNPQLHSADPRFGLKDTDGSVKDGTDDGLGGDDPSPPGGSGVTGAGVAGSFDPNEKQTLGFGANGFVAAGEALHYTILFENDPEHGATAPVQELLITDTLSANLDWTTFELTEMGFGEEAIPVPAGRQSYQTTANLAEDPYPVQVDAALNPATGEIRWYFASQDVTTRDLPEDPWAGFLPVNDETGQGEGYVSFRIQPKAGLANGAAIYNQATITFDPTYGVNPPIITNRVTNTLDLTPPTSSVQPLATRSPLTFNVAWAGNDGSGSGIAYYDVYVSTNGGPFTLWQTRTTAMSASFTGVDGATYGFYSVATDNVGHRQATPSAAQAVTTVSGGVNIYLPAISNGGQGRVTSSVGDGAIYLPAVQK